MMPQFSHTSLTSNSISSSQPSKETVTIEETVSEKLSQEIADKITLQCKNILHEFSQMQNLEVCIKSSYDMFKVSYFILIICVPYH